MKYILNESPIVTTNGFQINNIKLDLDIPTNYNFHNFEIKNISNVVVEEKNSFTSDIGLSHDKFLKVNINKDNYHSNKIAKLIYKFSNNDNLVDEINISLDNRSDINMLLKYESTNNDLNYHNGRINIIADNRSTINLTIINSLNSSGTNIIDINTESINNSKIIITLIDIGADKRIYRTTAVTKENSQNELKGIYIGKDNNIIDMCYNYINEGINSINIIEFEGLLNNSARKHFKGIIDFKSGCKKSIGKENENCILLSGDSISRSLPILLCAEEDVEGSHSVSSGMIDKDRLFYLMSRGINEEESKKLIIKTNFQKVLSNIPSELTDEISDIIDNNIN